mmetsp:Transcript_50045/g.89927  ORF Transcript_50045/g.89927 Transcript_50045/m.89927 type:complete len:469 (-) Transcript_50045:703-2109(-)
MPIDHLVLKLQKLEASAFQRPTPFSCCVLLVPAGIRQCRSNLHDEEQPSVVFQAPTRTRYHLYPFLRVWNVRQHQRNDRRVEGARDNALQVGLASRLRRYPVLTGRPESLVLDDGDLEEVGLEDALSVWSRLQIQREGLHEEGKVLEAIGVTADVQQRHRRLPRHWRHPLLPRKARCLPLHFPGVGVPIQRSSTSRVVPLPTRRQTPSLVEGPPRMSPQDLLRAQQEVVVHPADHPLVHGAQPPLVAHVGRGLAVFLEIALVALSHFFVLQLDRGKALRVPLTSGLQFFEALDHASRSEEHRPHGWVHLEPPEQAPRPASRRGSRGVLALAEDSPSLHRGCRAGSFSGVDLEPGHQKVCAGTKRLWHFLQGRLVPQPILLLLIHGTPTRTSRFEVAVRLLVLLLALVLLGIALGTAGIALGTAPGTAGARFKVPNFKVPKVLLVLLLWLLQPPSDLLGLLLLLCPYGS